MDKTTYTKDKANIFVFSDNSLTLWLFTIKDKRLPFFFSVQGIINYLIGFHPPAFSLSKAMDVFIVIVVSQDIDRHDLYAR